MNDMSILIQVAITSMFILSMGYIGYKMHKDGNKG